MTDRRTPGRPFGLVSATALVVANMIGAGLFTTSGFALADLGSRPRVMAAWLVGGVIALCGAVSYGGLVRRMAVSGGEYLFLSRVIHPGAGFLAGWVSLLAGFTGAIAFAATVFETYVVPESVRPAWLPAGAVGIAAIVVCGSLHGIVVRYGVRAQNAIVLLKLLFLVGFVGFALIRFGDTGWLVSQGALSGPSALPVACQEGVAVRQGDRQRRSSRPQDPELLAPGDPAPAIGSHGAQPAIRQG